MLGGYNSVSSRAKSTFNSSLFLQKKQDENPNTAGGVVGHVSLFISGHIKPFRREDDGSGGGEYTPDW
jgi:hypothetical protein